MSTLSVINDAEDKLTIHIDSLRNKFISGFFPANPSHRPIDYEHEVKAFCVLSHAAFEEFIEHISLIIMNDAMERWQYKRVASDSIIALCLYYDLTIKIQEKEEDVQKSCYDLLRAAIDDAKSRHSSAINNNHGFSLKYLRGSLTPVFVGIPEDARLLASLNTLAAARGSFAHSSAPDAFYKTAKKKNKSIAPEVADEVVGDCLELCRGISGNAKRLLPQIPQKLDCIFELRKKILDRRNLIKNSNGQINFNSKKLRVRGKDALASPSILRVNCRK